MEFKTGFVLLTIPDGWSISNRQSLDRERRLFPQHRNNGDFSNEALRTQGKEATIGILGKATTALSFPVSHYSGEVL